MCVLIGEWALQLAESRRVMEDSPCVKSLRATGALMLGKTCMVEFGLSAVGYNAVQGSPRNPYNVSHLCGGSSSGSAAAVASGLCPFALGMLTRGPCLCIHMGKAPLQHLTASL
jgi:Asp-tRNA(Asn)/Glu-tRNA(Gln) amidotransferase A subunit family amidase